MILIVHLLFSVLLNAENVKELFILLIQLIKDTCTVHKNARKNIGGKRRAAIIQKQEAQIKGCPAE